MITTIHNNHRRRCLKEVLWNSAARLVVFHSEFLHPLHKIFFLLCSTIAQNIVLLYSTLAQNISLFCSTLAQNIFSLFSTLAQNRIFKFVHLMCKIEFLGWSKSCTKYNFCSTLAQKRIGCSTLLQAKILVFSDKKLDWEYVLIHIVLPRAHSKWKPIQRFRFSSGWNLWMRIVQLPYKVEFCCIFHKRFKIQIQAHRSQVKTNLLLWQVTDEASSGALCFRP